MSTIFDCFALPTLNSRFYLLLILISLGIPWASVHFLISGLDVVQSQVVLLPRNPARIKNVARSKRRSYRHHTKFKSLPSAIRKNDEPNGGWASLPSLLPHIVPLLPCLPTPPIVPVTRNQIFEIMWAEAYWERILHEFLATQDPSTIMEVYQMFASQAPTKAWLQFQ